MPPFPLILTSVLLAVTLLVSAAVSALETALSALKEHHIASIGDTRPEKAGMMRAIARRPDRSLHQVLFLGSVLNLAMAVLGLLLIREIGVLFPEHPYLAALLVFGTLVVVSELVPTLVALAAPLKVFEAMIVPFISLSPWLESLSARLETITDRLSERLIPSGLKARRGLSDEEIETLVEIRRDQGVLALSESEIIQEIIRLGNKTAKDCMTPRVDALMMPDTLLSEAAIEFLRTSEDWHWHVPVYQGSPDLVIGVLDVRSWLFEPGTDFRQYVKPPVFVPETMNALEVFRDYLAAPGSLAIVLDEYGGVEGVLSHSDIIEEILADAAPSHDRSEEIEEISPGKLRADGDARLDEIADLLGLEINHEGLDTIGGLVFNEAGHVPEPGARIRIGELLVTVRRTRKQRIIAVEIEKCRADPGSDDEREADIWRKSEGER